MFSLPCNNVVADIFSPSVIRNQRSENKNLISHYLKKFQLDLYENEYLIDNENSDITVILPMLKAKYKFVDSVIKGKYTLNDLKQRNGSMFKSLSNNDLFVQYKSGKLYINDILIQDNVILQNGIILI